MPQRQENLPGGGGGENSIISSAAAEVAATEPGTVLVHRHDPPPMTLIAREVHLDLVYLSGTIELPAKVCKEQTRLYKTVKTATATAEIGKANH